MVLAWFILAGKQEDRDGVSDEEEDTKKWRGSRCRGEVRPPGQAGLINCQLAN